MVSHLYFYLKSELSLFQPAIVVCPKSLTVPAVITKSSSGHVLKLSFIQSWHPQLSVLGFHSYGSRPAFKGLRGKMSAAPDHFSPFKLLWTVYGNVPRQGFWDRWSSSEKPYESWVWPDVSGLCVFQESTVTPFSQNRWGKEDQSKNHSIWFGLLVAICYG